MNKSILNRLDPSSSNLLGICRVFRAPEWLITLATVMIITLVSVVLMLVSTSPEFSWDEAEYITNLSNSWGFLWRESDYARHEHGPMAIYLAKLGQEVLPAWTGSIEVRLRFFVALVGSLEIGLVYWLLRHSFRTSRAAALVGSCLLLFSVIRLEETNIIGPHNLMLGCTIAIIAFGYQWLNKPTMLASVVLGSVFGLSALSMTYVVPLALGWFLASSLFGKGWTEWKPHLKVTWPTWATFATAAIVIFALWPPGILRLALFRDFMVYVRWSSAHFPTLVGDHIFEVAPRSAVFNWIAHLDLPILVFSSSIIIITCWTAFKNRHLSQKHAYLGFFFAFFLAVLLKAHIAGARNLLQFIGVLCLITGALFDEALGSKARVIRFGTAVIITLAVINFLWFSKISTHVAYLTTDGYQAFLKENEKRLQKNSMALVYGTPTLDYYSKHYGIPIAWNVKEMPWTTFDFTLPGDVKYVLMPAFVYEYMPMQHPMRRIVADHWKPVWSYKANHVWDLRLYEKP